jgi:4-methyl-5(b-hydroxyethyl)-thiazole monophosphate biosynthesis
MIVLPGGQPGANHLEADARLRELLIRMAKNGQYTCAICAAPKVLASAGLLAGKRATGFPGVLENLENSDIHLETAAVVRDGNIVTSRGPGTAMDFALELIEILTDRQRRDRVEAALQRPI